MEHRLGEAKLQANTAEFPMEQIATEARATISPHAQPLERSDWQAQPAQQILERQRGEELGMVQDVLVPADRGEELGMVQRAAQQLAPQLPSLAAQRSGYPDQIWRLRASRAQCLQQSRSPLLPQQVHEGGDDCLRPSTAKLFQARPQ